MTCYRLIIGVDQGEDTDEEITDKINRSNLVYDRLRFNNSFVELVSYYEARSVSEAIYRASVAAYSPPFELKVTGIWIE